MYRRRRGGKAHLRAIVKWLWERWGEKDVRVFLCNFIFFTADPNAHADFVGDKGQANV